MEESRWRFKILIVLLIGPAVSGCYVFEQAKGQLSMRWDQVPLVEALASEKDSKIAKLLSHVPAIKEFSERVVLLRASENYTDYYYTAQEGVTFVVTASKKIELRPKTWWFLFVGTVPYKGFFNKNDALEFESELKEEGYDTLMFNSPAYSTLGWFRDPVTTPLLRSGLYSLANTIIHELTHLTLYVDDEGTFNEQLASFVGRVGASQYLTENGIDSAGFLERLAKYKEARGKIAKATQAYISELEKLYTGSLEISEKLKRREQVFQRYKIEMREKFPGYFKKDLVVNNAFLLQYKRYRSDPEFLETIWKESGQNWARFWLMVKAYVHKRKNLEGKSLN